MEPEREQELADIRGELERAKRAAGDEPHGWADSYAHDVEYLLNLIEPPKPEFYSDHDERFLPSGLAVVTTRHWRLT